MSMIVFGMQPPMKSSDTVRQLAECHERFLPPIEKSNEAYIWYSYVPSPILNGVMRLGPEGDMRATIDRIIEHAPQEVPYSFWVINEPSYQDAREHLEKKQFAPAMRCSLMRWNVKGVEMPAADIRPAEMDLFHEILGGIFQFDVTVKQSYSDLMKKGPCENYLLYVDGKPVSTGTLVIAGGYHGGIFNESILPGYESHQHEMIQFLMHRARSLRMQQLVVLSAPDYESTYLSLGFEKTGEVDIYISTLN